MNEQTCVEEMSATRDKIAKLAEIARLYYEQERNQSDIAKIFGVSRPLISRMLKEAKELGVVQIRIDAPVEGGFVLNQARNIFGLRGGVLIPSPVGEGNANQEIASRAIDYLKELGGLHIGIGWGTIIGMVVSLLERQTREKEAYQSVCPLVGNSSVSNRNYHSNENVRIFSESAGAHPFYLHAPAIAESGQELELIRQLENYKTVEDAWRRLDVALVNIGNYPSTPDFASVARFGDLLSRKKAVGRLLMYCFDIHGEIIRSDTDYSVQIPTRTLAGCRKVVGICAANVKPQAVLGALRTGLVHHLVVVEDALKAALELR